MNNLYGYKLFKKTNNRNFKLLYSGYAYAHVLKIIKLYKKRKLIVNNETKKDIKTTKWKIVPITRHEAFQAQKDVPF